MKKKTKTSCQIIIEQSLGNIAMHLDVSKAAMQARALLIGAVWVCACACVRVCVRACVRACMCVCAYACACVGGV